MRHERNDENDRISITMRTFAQSGLDGVKTNRRSRAVADLFDCNINLSPLWP